ncbi:TonB-dependent receptor [Labilibacter sediminis]|nr:TonB-dependent receptor [Labilibacter sediminis]
MKKVLIYLLCTILPVVALAQERTVTGRVVDSDTRESIPGVNIVIQNTSSGTITDMEGAFRLSNVKTGDVLVISFIGYEQKKLKVGEKSELNILLKQDITELDEVIAVGYGVMKKSDLTGSVASVGVEQFKMTENVTLDQALEGRVAGLQVSSGDGSVGGASEIFIRGVGSINSNTQPLYVIDGFPIEYSYDKEKTVLGEEGHLDPLVNINPDDIESIEVLKDASATSIYGARGANGVIIITTKKGEAGKTDISLNVRYGVKKLLARDQMDVLESVDYAFYQHEHYPDHEDWMDPASYKDSTNTNWQEEIYGDGYAFSQSYDLAIGGGTKQTTFRTNFNYTDESGIVKNSSLQKFSGAFKLNHKAGKWMNMFVDLKLGTAGNNASATGGTGGTHTSYGSVLKALSYAPTKSPESKDSQEDLEDEENPHNPLTDINNVKNVKKNTDMMVNTRFLFNITPALTFMVRGGYTISYADRRQFYPGYTSRGSKKNGLNIYSNNNKTNLLAESTLTYMKSFNKHSINAVAGVSYNNRTDWYNDATNTGFVINDLGVYNMGGGVVPEKPNSEYFESKLQSTLGRLNYNYDNRYLVTFAFRVDGSSKFGAGNKFAYFPSGAISWRASEETFLKSQEWLDNLKLRASYGVSGNQGVPNGLAKWTYNTSYYNFNNVENSSSIIHNVADPYLKWETSSMVDAGIDFVALNQRLNLTFDVYNKETFDMLLESSVPSETGFPKDWTNIGKMRNRGFEISITGHVLRNRDYGWSISANYAKNENTVLELADKESMIIDEDYILQEGQAVGSHYGYVADGIFWTEEDAAMGPHEVGKAARPGYRRFVDMNDDGYINNLDKIIIGQGHPEGFGSFSNTFNYKGLELRAMFTFRHGNDIYNATREKLEDMQAKPTKNKLATINDRWRPADSYYPGDPGNLQGSLPGIAYKQQLHHTAYLESGDFIKFRSVSLQYHLSNNIVRKMGLKKLSVRTTFENIYTWTSYSGYNPEVSMSKNKGLKPGLDSAGAPAPLIATFGISAKF